MALTAEKKTAIAHRICDLATGKYGLRPTDLIFDALTVPISTGQEEYRSAGIETLNAIAGYVQNLPSLNAGQKNSLTVKLNAAAASASRGDMKTSNNQLNAFLNELQAYVNTGKVSALDAANLRGAVYAVKGSIGMYNRFLEWWPLGI